jgi:putative peptidoglycan binding protein
MRRKWTYILMIALLMTLVSADVASAKKHRSSRGASRSASRSNVKRASHRGRAGRELSRREKRGRGKYAARDRRGRRLARSRRHSRVRYEPQAAVTPSTSRPSPGITAERAAEIQGALIKAGYMDAPASGTYDEATIEAMKKFQAANGMSQTGLPSAPLLKKLGVPKRSNDGYAVPVNSVSQTDKKRTQEE